MKGERVIESKISIPGFQRGACCLEVFKYFRASKSHSFVTPGT